MALGGKAVNIKLFEVRDRATAIPCFGILMEPGYGLLSQESILAEDFLLKRAGYGAGYPLVLFGRLEGDECHYDPYSWRANPRTLRSAHVYISENWATLRSGDVVDVEFILGESKEPKKSERVG